MLTGKLFPLRVERFSNGCINKFNRIFISGCISIPRNKDMLMLTLRYNDESIADNSFYQKYLLQCRCLHDFESNGYVFAINAIKRKERNTFL